MEAIKEAIASKQGNRGGSPEQQAVKAKLSDLRNSFQQELVRPPGVPATPRGARLPGAWPSGTITYAGPLRLTATHCPVSQLGCSCLWPGLPTLLVPRAHTACWLGMQRSPESADGPAACPAQKEKQRIRQELDSHRAVREQLAKQQREMKTKCEYLTVDQVDEAITRLEQRMTHTSMSLNEEKKAIEDIKRLKVGHPGHAAWRAVHDPSRRWLCLAQWHRCCWRVGHTPAKQSRQ